MNKPVSYLYKDPKTASQICGIKKKNRSTEGKTPHNPRLQIFSMRDKSAQQERQDQVDSYSTSLHFVVFFALSIFLFLSLKFSATPAFSLFE
jgi:hypothetical protein